MTLLRDCVESALGEYIGVYGDKTKVIDATTGKPKVDHHYDLAPDKRLFPHHRPWLDWPHGVDS